MNVVHVRMADYRVAEGPGTLASLGIGSCLVVAIYDRRRQLGGLAHALLPQYDLGPGTDDPKKYVDRLIAMLIQELVQRGARAGGLEAKIAGGARMFAGLENDTRRSIGERNVAWAERTLAELRIPVVARDVGGDYGRSVILDLDSGDLKIRSYRAGEKTI